MNNEFIATPNAEKTTENPRTKNTVFRITLVLFIEIVCDSVDFVKSEIVIPEIYRSSRNLIKCTCKIECKSCRFMQEFFRHCFVNFLYIYF